MMKTVRQAIWGPVVFVRMCFLSCGVSVCPVANALASAQAMLVYDVPRSLIWITLDSRRPVSSMLVLLAFGTTLRSLPLVIRRRWTEEPETSAIMLYRSSPEASSAMVRVLGSLRMGLPVHCQCLKACWDYPLKLGLDGGELYMLTPRLHGESDLCHCVLASSDSEAECSRQIEGT